VQFRLALLDLAAGVVGLITLVTVWNAYSLVVQLRDAYKRYKGLIRTLASSTLSCSNHITHRRHTTTHDTTRHAEATSGAHVYSLKQGAQCHAVVFYNFALLVIDVPFLLLLLPLIVCGWRGAEVLRLWRRTDDYWAQRRGIAMQFLLLLFDLPAAVCLAVLLVSWRAFSTVRQLRALWTTSTTSADVAPDAVAASTAAEPSAAEAPADAVSGEVNADSNRRRKRRERAATRAVAAKTSAAQQQPTSFHRVVFSEFGRLALDLPFVIVAPLMLWRLPFFLRRLFQVPTQGPSLALVTEWSYLLIVIYLRSTHCTHTAGSRHGREAQDAGGGTGGRDAAGLAVRGAVRRVRALSVAAAPRPLAHGPGTQPHPRTVDVWSHHSLCVVCGGVGGAAVDG
jgi:hypothetical protein